MGKKYVVKYGYDKQRKKKIINQIYDTWDEAKKYVSGVSGADYKSFKESQKTEMEKYLKLKNKQTNNKKKKKDKKKLKVDNIHTVYLVKASAIKNNKKEYYTQVCNTQEDLKRFLVGKKEEGRKIVSNINSLSDEEFKNIIAKYFNDKIYVVKKGYDEKGNPVSGLTFYTWEETQKYIKGKNVSYKSFYNTPSVKKEIALYLREDNSDITFKDIDYEAKVYYVKKGKCPRTGKLVKNVVFCNWEKAKTYLKNMYDVKKYQNLLDLDNKVDDYLLMFSYKKHLSPKSVVKKLIELGLEETTQNHFNSFIIPEASNELHCYVDGSYNKTINNYGAGIVCIKNNKILYKKSISGSNQDASSMHQIAGELLGAIYALKYAKAKGFNQVTICYDYKGIEKYITEEWKTKNPFTKQYKKWVFEFKEKNPNIKIKFKKIDAHSKELFNEIADGLAKKAVNIRTENIHKEANEVAKEL